MNINPSLLPDKPKVILCDCYIGNWKCKNKATKQMTTEGRELRNYCDFHFHNAQLMEADK